MPRRRREGLGGHSPTNLDAEPAASEVEEIVPADTEEEATAVGNEPTVEASAELAQLRAVVTEALERLESGDEREELEDLLRVIWEELDDEGKRVVKGYFGTKFKRMKEEGFPLVVIFQSLIEDAGNILRDLQNRE